MRLVDIDALIKVYCADCAEDVREGCKEDPVCLTLGWLKEQPTIDAEPVVRCKDCRNSELLGSDLGPVRYCDHWQRNTDDDGYCHEGV